MATTNLTVRIDESIKAQFDALCNELGLSASTAVNIFARAMVREQGFPFPITMRDEPNAETIAAMLEAREIAAGRIPAKRYATAQEAFAELDAEMETENAEDVPSCSSF